MRGTSSKLLKDQLRTVERDCENGHPSSSSLSGLVLVSLSVVDGIKCQFDPVRSPDLVEYPKQIVADRVLAEIELPRDITVCKTFGY